MATLKFKLKNKIHSTKLKAFSDLALRSIDRRLLRREYRSIRNIFEEESLNWNG